MPTSRVATINAGLGSIDGAEALLQIAVRVLIIDLYFWAEKTLSFSDLHKNSDVSSISSWRRYRSSPTAIK